LEEKRTLSLSREARPEAVKKSRSQEFKKNHKSRAEPRIARS